MIETKRTPGPWKIGLAHTFEDGGEGLFEIEAEYLGVRSRGGDFGRVCIVTGAGDADARLIAAAPDLLAALQAIVDAMDDGSENPGIDNARAIIARVTGDQS